MATLFEIDRPTSNTPAVKEASLTALLPKVIAWLDDEYDGDEISLREQLLNILVPFNGDGYRRTKALEDRYYWSGDSELVDILEGWDRHLYASKAAAVREWVKECGIKPAHKLGEAVSAKWGRDVISGQVVRVNEAVAEYTVRRKGDGPESGAVVEYENVLEQEAVP